MIAKRKRDHVDICLRKEVHAGETGLDGFRLLHRAVPELDMEKIDLSTRFLGHRFALPFIVTAITGGYPQGRKINANIAEACESLGVGMGVGSQRAALEDPIVAKTYSIARQKAPSAFLISNIGAVQLLEYSLDEIASLVEMIDGNALAVHFNALQEAVQPEGDTNFKGVLKKLERVSRSLKVPVIAKETGAGFSPEDAKLLKRAGVKAVDVAGLGGTSFSLVESYRGSQVGKTFADWGIPTAASISFCAGLPTIASGGIRNGRQAAVALALGADMAGFALPVLKPAMKSPKAVRQRIELMARELRTAMFLTASNDLKALKRAKFLV